jgi:hypothetical protein
MEISKLAGKPADPSLLINVPFKDQSHLAAIVRGTQGIVSHAVDPLTQVTSSGRPANERR